MRRGRVAFGLLIVGGPPGGLCLGRRPLPDWNQIEAYICQHTEAAFTHGLCPGGTAALQQEMQARREQRGGEKPPR